MSAASQPGPTSGDGCPVSDVFDLLGRAHMLAVLHGFTEADGGPLRFNELETSLSISPNTLSARLKELTRAGLLERRSYDEIPPRVEYEATAKAEDLCGVFDEIEAWARRHDLEPVQTT